MTKYLFIIFTIAMVSLSHAETIAPPPEPTVQNKITEQKILEQRRQIEEIKLLFAEIDKKIEKIESIHRSIERILRERDREVACILLDKMKNNIRTAERLIENAADDAIKVAQRSKISEYKSIYNRVLADMPKLSCAH